MTKNRYELKYKVVITKLDRGKTAEGTCNGDPFKSKLQILKWTQVWKTEIDTDDKNKNRMRLAISKAINKAEEEEALAAVKV